MNILFIYTGGTIGMVPSDQGWRSQPGYLESRIREYLRRHEIATSITWLEYDPLLDSSQVQPADWNRLAADILAGQKDHDGVVVLHGTDTMAYTAAALTFMLRGRHKPVVVTGSQVPVWEAHTDGLNNVLQALHHAENPQNQAVYLSFDGKLYHGAHVTKMDSDRLKGFAAPHGIHLGPLTGSAEGAPRLLLTESTSIEIYHHLPGTRLAGLQALVNTRPRALIQLTYGSGNAPNTDELRAILQRARDHGTLLLNRSQCFRANVDMDRYAAAAALRDAGVVGVGTMTLEAVVAKLHVLFNMYDKPEDVLRELLTPWSQELPVAKG